MKRAYIDLHSHLLYGMDNGASDMVESLRMLMNAQRDGAVAVVATPHVEPGVTVFDINRFQKRLRRLSRAAAEEGIRTLALPGAEILYTPDTVRMLNEGAVPTLAGTKFVLVEFRPRVPFEELRYGVRCLLRAGYKPLLSHVERYRCFLNHPVRALWLHDEMEVYYQMNAQAVQAERKWRLKRLRDHLIDWDVLDVIASDAHAPGERSARLRPAFAWVDFYFGTQVSQIYAENTFIINLTAPE